jgi:hypothetical protein
MRRKRLGICAGKAWYISSILKESEWLKDVFSAELLPVRYLPT